MSKERLETTGKKNATKKKRSGQGEPELQRPKLTARQQKVLDYVIDTISKNGFPPTLREIGEHMGIKSTNGVSDHLKALERKGYLKKSSLRARALTPILDESEETTPEDVRSVPVVGKVAAGTPIARIEDCDRRFAFDNALLGNPSDEIIALEVRGDSMINDGIREGDFLLIRKQPYANNGEIVVAVIDDEVTVKRFYRESDHIRLQPANDNLEPIFLSSSEWQDLSVIGISVGLYRKY